MSELLSILALVVSILTFFYVARTHAVKYRPYIGIVAIQTKARHGLAPDRIEWVCDVKNAGSVPAWVNVDEHRPTLTTEGETTTVEPIQEAGLVMFLMPEQTFTIDGQVSYPDYGRGTVRDVLGGATTLDVIVGLTYESRGLFGMKSRYTYKVTNRFVEESTGPTFVVVSADAD